MEKPTQLSTELGNSPVTTISGVNSQTPTTEDGKLRRLNQLIEGCSVAGLMHATSASNRMARVFWTILLLCGVVGFFTNLSFLIQQYLREPVLTEISHDTDVFAWPDISFCNPTSPIPFSISNGSLLQKWENLKQKGWKLKEKGSHLRNYSMEELLMASIDHKEFHTAELQHIIKTFYVLVETDHIQEYSGYFARDTNVNIDVKEEDWFMYRWVPMPTPVNCYTFRMNEFYSKFVKKESQGKMVGLHLMMELNLNDFLHFNTSLHLRGVRVSINSPNHSLLSSRFSNVGTGISVKFEISQSKIERIHRRNNCRQRDYIMDLYNPTFTRTYKVQGGFSDCLYATAQKIYLEHCGCYNSLLPIINEGRATPRHLCLNMTQFNSSQILKHMECMSRVRLEIKITDNNVTVDKQTCHVYKKPSCDDTIFTVDQNEYHWPRVLTEEVRRQVMGLIGQPFVEGNSTDWINRLRDNYLMLDFIAESDHIRVIKEEYEYPFSKLLSDIGGIMGLWIGINIVSIFELLEIFNLFVIFLKRKICPS